MRRRDILLAGAGSLATGASLTFPAPAIAQGIRHQKMVTDWPSPCPSLKSLGSSLICPLGGPPLDQVTTPLMLAVSLASFAVRTPNNARAAIQSRTTYRKSL